MNKKEAFRALLTGPEHFFLMEAHDGLSAKIAEEAGFSAIWASGLSITAALGVRDNNEISYTQLLNVLEFMNDACALPILVDGDTGYGNFNNACILSRKLEERGIAAVCIEDKKFPKTNSFLENSIGSLADPAEFAGKIRAMKSVQLSKEFAVIARLESLIVGAGVNDAVKRAEIYLNAGADAILVHSKRYDSKEIDDFLAAFDKEAPVFLVPTKYYSVPVKHLTRDKRVRGIIWANHSIRAAAKAMQDVCNKIFAENSIAGVEDAIVPVSEIFRLQKQDEYFEMEKKYLPANYAASAIILAAGSSELLGIDKPKTLIRINGRSILDNQIAALKSVGIEKITIVRGYKKELIDFPEYTYVDNDNWNETGAVYSLSLASKNEKKPYIVLYSDVFFKRYLLHTLIGFSNETDADIILVCVKEDYIFNGFALKTDKEPDLFGNNDNLRITAVVGEDCENAAQTVFFSGLMMVKNHTLVNQLFEHKTTNDISAKSFFAEALSRGLKIAAILTSTDTLVDINYIDDLIKAEELR